MLVSIQRLIPDIDTRDLKTVEDVNDDIEDTSVDTPFAAVPFRLMQEKNDDLQKVLQSFNDQVVIDLGSGGKTSTHKTIQLMDWAGAKGYIAVEDRNFKSALKGIEDAELLSTVVPEDVLSFLKRLPDRSVSIFSSGDELLAPWYTFLKKRKIMKEISRVLSVEGAYIEYRGGSDLGDYSSGELSLEKKKIKHYMFYAFKQKND